MQKIYVIFQIIITILLVSCTRATSNEALNANQEFTTIMQEQNQDPSESLAAKNNNTSAQPVRQRQGFPTGNPEFDLETIGSEFFGVYLPVEYIKALKNTRNHSLSMHLNLPFADGRYHDVLSVFENRIFSNLRFHDRYAIRTSDVNYFEFVNFNGAIKIVDNNGHFYKKIGNDPANYHNTVGTFVANIIFENLINQHISISINDGVINIPYLREITGESNFFIVLNDLFFEKGLNLLLNSANPDNRFVLALVIDGNDYFFYYIEPNRDFSADYPKRSDNILHLNIE